MRKSIMRAQSLSILCSLFLALNPTAYAQVNTLKPFTTDGCSLWLDGPPKQPNLWRSCCVAHDIAYWIGGTSTQRKQADAALKVCVTDTAGKGMAEYMYWNVLWGGSAYWLTPYRWGYGWQYLEEGKPRGYKTPTPEEQLHINQLLPLAEKLVAEDAAKHPLH
jgi:hypothetical protein